MKEIDVFKLATELGFDVRGAELRNNKINSFMLINEEKPYILPFNSNKVIFYNCKKSIDIKRNSVAKHIFNYINLKINNDIIKKYGEINKILNPIININMLFDECVSKGLIEDKTVAKRLYKKMHN